MAHLEDSRDWLGSQLLLVNPGTEFGEMLDETEALWRACPEILARIRADQRAWGLARKAARLAAREQATAPTPLMFEPDSGRSAGLRLGTGRPPLDARLVLLAVVFRGRYGSVWSQVGWERFCDSAAMRGLLLRLGLRLPSAATLDTHLKLLREETLRYIVQCLLARAKAEGLDDFTVFLGDSTAVAANSAWPLASELLYGWQQRAFDLGQRLAGFGLANLRQWRVPRWLAELKWLNRELNTVRGKPGAKRRRRCLYGQVFERTEKVLRCLEAEWDRAMPGLEAQWFKLAPPERRELASLRSDFETCISQAWTVLEYEADRQAHGAKAAPREEHEELYSRSDPSARFIIKGGRETVFGYKPQLGQSRNGFITALRVHQGNVADSVELKSLVLEHIAQTGVVPETVSVDDGYASAAQAAAVRALGCEVVSVKGSKGKRQTPPELWESEAYKEARRLRGRAESPISVLKGCYDFGELRRRGLPGVSGELWEKVIAYNLCRTVQLRARKRQERLRAAG